MPGIHSARHDYLQAGAVETSNLENDEAQVKMDSVRRKLSYDLHAIFAKIQSINKTGKFSFDVKETSYLSQRYRSAIRSAITYLNASDDYEEFDKELIGDDLLSAQIVWSLFEAVTVRPAANSITIDLMEWGKECAFPPSDIKLSVMMDELRDWPSTKRFEKHQHYWCSVLQQVMSGKFETAAVLLKHHSKYKSGEADYHRVVNCLEQVELALARNRTSCEEFLRIQKDLNPIRQAVPSNCHDLKFLYSLLLGDWKAFVECSMTLSMTWYELLPTFLLFTHPMTKPQNVGKLAKEFYKEIKKVLPSEETLLDRILFAILSLDCLEAIKLICSAGSQSWWIVVHFVDLISNHDNTIFMLSIDSTNDDLNLQMRVLTNYANMLFESDGMWEIAIDYFIATGVEDAFQIIEERLSKIDWNDDIVMAEKIVATCERYGFHKAKYEITRAATLMHVKAQEWNAALCWSLRNGNVDLIGQVSQKILFYMDSKNLAQMHIFDALSEKFLLTPDLHILFKFYKYKHLINQSDLIRAIGILHELFLDNSAPDKFFVTLLQEITRLLTTFNAEEFEECVSRGSNALSSDDSDRTARSGISSDAIQNLLEALAKFEHFYSIRCFRKMNDNDEVKKELVKLRTQLVRLLSHSFFTDQLY